MTDEKKVIDEKKDKQDAPTPKRAIEVKVPTAEQLLEAGVHFGHRTSRWNPKMKGYIFGVRNGVHIFDLEKTVAKLQEAAVFAAETAQNGSYIIFVGTKPAVRKAVREAAIVCSMPFVDQRWLGGTLTNFKSISKRLEYFRDLEAKLAAGELKKYTKKEQLGFKKQLEELEKSFGGIKNLMKLPGAIFVSDLKENRPAVAEAKIAGVKVIAIADSSTDPNLADYPIPANDDALSSVKIIVETLAEAIKNNR